jgi:hypothetical protein
MQKAPPLNKRMDYHYEKLFQKRKVKKRFRDVAGCILYQQDSFYHESRVCTGRR